MPGREILSSFMLPTAPSKRQGPRIIANLNEKKLKFVTVSEMIANSDATVREVH